MSWALLADMDVTLPAPAWTRIQAKKPRDVTLAKGWSGLEEASLEDAFVRLTGRHLLKEGAPA